VPDGWFSIDFPITPISLLSYDPIRAPIASARGDDTEAVNADALAGLVAMMTACHSPTTVTWLP
jgi:hypothetical protein